MDCVVNQPNMVRGILDDVYVINGIVFIKIQKKRRNRWFRRHLECTATPYILLRNHPNDYYYYAGGFKLLREFDEMSKGKVTEIIGESNVKRVEKFWSEYDSRLPISLAWLKQHLKKGYRIAFVNRLYYIINLNVLPQNGLFTPDNSRYSLYINGSVNDYYPEFERMRFMIKDFKHYNPTGTKWEFKTIKLSDGVKVRVYPYLGKSTEKFIITDSEETVAKFVEIYGEEFKKLYYYLESVKSNSK